LKEEVHRSEAVNFLLNQIKVEEELVKLYKNTSDMIISEQARRLLKIIMLDSMKHVEICRTAIEVIEGENLDMDERLEFEVGLKKHIELEIDSLKRAELLLENPVVESKEYLRTLVENWIDDEKKHHVILKGLSDGEMTRRNVLDAFTRYRMITREKLQKEFFRRGY
jgi:rubrerythrin